MREAGPTQLIQTTESRRFTLAPLPSSAMDPGGIPQSPDGETATSGQIPKYRRSLRSLNVLAARFVALLQEAEGGTLDLKDVSELGPVKSGTQQTSIPSREMFCHVCNVG